MIKTVLAAALGTIVCLLGSWPASAQTDAQDRCIETAVSNVLADPLIKRDTFYWLARLSAGAAGQQSNEPAPSGPISIEGITAPLSYADVERMLRPLLLPADWQTIYRNRAAVLLTSGQQPVVQALQNCLTGLGGGLSAYFQAVPNQPTSIELHVEYLRPENAGELPTWRVAKNVTLEPRLGKVVGAARMSRTQLQLRAWQRLRDQARDAVCLEQRDHHAVADGRQNRKRDFRLPRTAASHSRRAANMADREDGG